VKSLAEGMARWLGEWDVLRVIVWEGAEPLAKTETILAGVRGWGEHYY